MVDALASWDLRAWVAAALTALVSLSLILRYRKPSVPVWCYMAFFSFLAVASGLIPVEQVPQAIDLEVILFLIGMFSIVSLAESSGLLDLLAWKVMGRPKTVYSLLLLYSLTFGLLASIAMNDTMAVMGPPIAYSLSRVTGIDLEALILLLAFSITIGSTMTPVGNPQNVLIAVQSGMRAPLTTFLKFLLAPTILNLALTTVIVAKLYNVKNGKVDIKMEPREFARSRDAYVASAALAAVILALLLNDTLALLNLPHTEHIGVVPFVVAAGALPFARRPREVIKSVDWGTIIFFTTMFITMKAIWDSGVLYTPLKAVSPLNTDPLANTLQVTLASLLFSQLLSNVPFVKLYIDYLHTLGNTRLGNREWIALAMSSTIAGNLTLLGAASNIIILEAVESRYGRTISPLKFMKVGAIVTALNTLVYLPFLVLLS